MQTVCYPLSKLRIIVVLSRQWTAVRKVALHPYKLQNMYLDDNSSSEIKNLLPRHRFDELLRDTYKNTNKCL
jgi:hypothetical protein